MSRRAASPITADAKTKRRRAAAAAAFAAEPEAERALASEAAENGERASSAPSKPLAASGDANISLANALWREEGETPWSLAARGGATPGGTQARVASAERESGLEGRPRVRGDALETGTSLVIKRRSDESRTS